MNAPGTPGRALQIVDHDSDHGRWTLVRCQPAAMLRPYVLGYQGYVENTANTVCRRELPSVVIPFIINFGEPFRLHDPANICRSRPISTFVAGLHERYVTVSSSGAASCMQVDFTPLGARRFLGLPLDALTGDVVELSALIGAAGDDLAARLHDATDWPARFGILDSAIAQRIADGPKPSAMVAEAWRRIAASGGRIGIGALARDLDCSRKHLTGRFSREIGLPPKRVSRILRFERAIAGLNGNRIETLAGLAHACGYYDQSHFDRDFRDFAGESPTALLRRLLPDGTGIMDDPHPR